VPELFASVSSTVIIENRTTDAGDLPTHPQDVTASLALLVRDVLGEEPFVVPP